MGQLTARKENLSRNVQAEAAAIDNGRTAPPDSLGSGAPVYSRVSAAAAALLVGAAVWAGMTALQKWRSQVRSRLCYVKQECPADKFLTVLSLSPRVVRPSGARIDRRFWRNAQCATWCHLTSALVVAASRGAPGTIEDEHSKQKEVWGEGANEEEEEAAEHQEDDEGSCAIQEAAVEALALVLVLCVCAKGSKRVQPGQLTDVVAAALRLRRSAVGAARLFQAGFPQESNFNHAIMTLV